MVFPWKELTFVSETNEYRRYHLHVSLVQKAIRKAVRKSKILKRATAHTFRHSFASHLLQAIMIFGRFRNFWDIVMSGQL